MALIESSPIMKHEAMKVIKNIDQTQGIAELGGHAAKDQVGYLVEWMKSHENARPEAFGTNMLYNALKSQFIDPVFNARGQWNGGTYGECSF